MADIYIRNYSHSPIPTVLFKHIGKELLPTQYELSIVGVGAVRATNLNKQYRNKAYAPDVLSFPLSNTTGEICMHVDAIYKDAQTYNVPKKEYITFLYIHSILHLKGYTHGKNMENEEHRLCKRYAIAIPHI